MIREEAISGQARNKKLLYLLAGIIVTIICSVAAYYLWNKAIEGIGVKITSNLILFMPLVSIIAGIVSFGERLTLQIMVSAVLLLSGVWLASKTLRGEEF